MLYVYIGYDNLAVNYEQEFEPIFPEIPINERFSRDYVERLVEIEKEENAPIGYVYDWDTKTFSEPPEPETISTFPQDLQQAIEIKTGEINASCNASIGNGFDYNGSHYSLSIEDQANILSLSVLAQSEKDVPYHADGEECRIYTASEFMEVAQAATAFKTHHTTYCNLLKMQVKAMDNTEDVYAVKYGDTKLNDEFVKRYDEIMSALAD